MANGYGYTEHSFGYTPPRKPKAPVAPRPDNRAGPFGANPAFPTLSSGTHTPAAPAAPSFTQDQVNASLAANPNASKGAYMGPPMGPQVPQAAAAAPAAPNLGYDYNTDPILQSIKALSTQQRGDAQSGALAAKKKLAIDYNDSALANALGDPNTAQAAAGNQFGVLEQLKHGYQQGQDSLDQQLNDQNLFYSGHRIKTQGDLTHDYQGQQAAASGQEQELLGQIGSQLAAALLAADQSDIGGVSDAANRGINFALANGIDPGAGGGPTVDTGAGTGGEAPPPADTSVADVLANLVNTTSGSSGLPNTPSGAPLGLVQSLGGGIDPLAYALSQQNKRKQIVDLG